MEIFIEYVTRVSLPKKEVSFEDRSLSQAFHVLIEMLLQRSTSRAHIYTQLSPIDILHPFKLF
jgi:hypothetical protein